MHKFVRDCLTEAVRQINRALGFDAASERTKPPITPPPTAPPWRLVRRNYKDIEPLAALAPLLDNLIKKNNLAEIEAAEEVKAMPPKYLDGCFRQKWNGLEYRFMFEGAQRSVFAASKQLCFDKRTAMIAGQSITPATARAHKTFGEWLEHWYASYKAPHLGEQSADRVRRILNNHVLPGLGANPFSKLNHDMLQTFINGLIKHPNTQKKVYDVVHGSLERARVSGKIKTNPADGLILKRYTPKKHGALQINQQAAVEDVLKTKDPKFLRLFKFCCCTGIRIGRVLELTRDDIDRESGEFVIKKKQKLGLEETYRVPFLPELLEGLPERGKLFANINLRSAQEVYERVFEQLGIKGVTIHSFRHTFISTLRFLKVEFDLIKGWVGHANLAMTADVYTHMLKNEGGSPILEYLRRLKDAQKV
jgi:integrase